MCSIFHLQIACGMDHTLLLSGDGEVFSCGWGADGQTGKAVACIKVVSMWHAFNL